jgi:hypothetical protein
MANDTIDEAGATSIVAKAANENEAATDASLLTDMPTVEDQTSKLADEPAAPS